MPCPEDLKGGHRARSDAIPWTRFEIRSDTLRPALNSESYLLVWTCFELSRQCGGKVQRANKIRLERKISSLSSPGYPNNCEASNAGLQLRRAISIHAEGTKLLEKHAIAPSAARLC